jgi:type II secretory pathway pseudopilin PulG
MKKKLKFTKGFTLIEAILYLAIAGTIIYFVSGFAFNAIFGQEKIQEVQDIDISGRSMLDDIVDSIGSSVDINNDE